MEKKETDTKSENVTRTWSNKMDFIMAAVSAAIGLGNLWRFPYQCYRNGGGAFLLPFLIMIILAAFPQVLADIALGQYGRKGAVKAYRATPIISGVGWLLILLSLHIDVYYVVVVSYTVFYTFASFTSQLPWVYCGNWWNTDDCTDVWLSTQKTNCTTNNGSWVINVCQFGGNLTQHALNQDIHNGSILTVTKAIDASEEYFNNYVLQLSSGISDIGTPRWPIVLCVLFTLSVVFVSLILGAKTWGKLAYVFALVPFAILFAILIQCLLRDGAVTGIIYFLTPRWSELAKPQVWIDAVGQAFFSLGCAGGSLITIGSYNKFKNDCVRDTVIVTVCDTMTSFLCGIVVFSILGFMAHELDVSIDEVVGKGAGMTFVVYSAALAKLPSAPIWSAVFMFMIFNLGVGSMVCTIATVHKVVMEELPSKFQKRRCYSILGLVAVLLFWFLIGLVYTTNGGMYVLQMMDMNVTYILLLVGLMKTITVAWVYGINRLYDDIKTMGGYRPWQLLAWTHKFITPGILTFVLILSFTQYKPMMYNDYIYPFWAEALGWTLTFLTLLVVPAVAIYKLVTFPEKLPMVARIKALSRPALDWEYNEGNMEEVRNETEKEIFINKRVVNENAETETPFI